MGGSGSVEVIQSRRRHYVVPGGMAGMPPGREPVHTHKSVVCGAGYSEEACVGLSVVVTGLTSSAAPCCCCPPAALLAATMLLPPLLLPHCCCLPCCCPPAGHSLHTASPVGCDGSCSLLPMVPHSSSWCPQTDPSLVASSCGCSATLPWPCNGGSTRETPPLDLY